MTDFYSLVKDTEAYKTVKRDKDKNTLSHAYLIIVPDEENLKQYLKVFASLILCREDNPCKKCRDCTLIQEEIHSDVLFFPEKDGAVLTSDVNKIVEESYFKPVEGNKKVFVIYAGQTMNATSQNKLLKTLEEPPENVHIILGATSEFPLLQTVKSRMKRLEIASFSNEKIFSALKDECTDLEKLKKAVACGDGTVSKAKILYGSEDLVKISSLVLDVLENMKSSREVLKYSVKILNQKIDFTEFLSVLELYFRDLAVCFTGKQDLVLNREILSSPVLNVGYNLSSCVYALSKIEEAKERKKFNANATMLLEWLLFQILEGKYKWQKC